MGHYSHFVILIYTLDPGVGAITFAALVAFIVTLATLVAIVRRSKDWPEAIRLHIGLGLLTLWFITHWIDLVISHTKPDVSPYVQIYTLLTHLLKIPSDVLVITGLWAIIIRYDFLRPLKGDSVADTVFVGFLWVLSIVHAILWITDTGLILSPKGLYDFSSVNGVSRARSAFEVTFMAVQFCTSAVMIIYAFSRTTERKPGCDYFENFPAMALAAFALFLRSFCEIVIVGQLDRVNSFKVGDAQRARDVMYGLLSVYLVWVVVYAVPQKGKEDPLVAKDHAAVEEIKRQVEGKIEAVVDDGKNTAPTMSKVLNEVEADLRAQYPDGKVPEDKQQEHYMKLNEIKRLRKQYGNWEPVYKGGGNTDGQNDIIELVEQNDRTLADEGQGASRLERMVKRLWSEKPPKDPKDGKKTKVVDTEPEAV